MKQFFTLLVTFILCTNAMFALKIGDLYYTLDGVNQTAKVTYEVYSEGKNYKGLKSAHIPNEVEYFGVKYRVTSIGLGAFYTCETLISITIDEGIDSIEGSAFFGCTGLTSIEIPNSVTKIGDYAFSKCSSLLSLTIGNGVTDIGIEAFSYCNSLTSVVVPNSVARIGASAFNSCNSLKSIEIPNSVTSIEGGAFYHCTSLESIEIPNSVTSIENYTFYYCYGLTSVTIPNSVTIIGSKAFKDCDALKTITLPCSITDIGEQAFYSCNGLEYLTCEATVPPALGTDVFNYCDKTMPLFVPFESIDLYKVPKQWKDFTNILPISTTVTKYKVIFLDWNGSLLKMDEVRHGDAAAPPADPSREWYTFIGWDKDFSHVTGDMIVTAQYKEGQTIDYSLLFTNGIDNSEIATKLIAIEFPAPTSIDGFTFIKWEVVLSESDNTIEFKAVYSYNGDPSSAPEVVTNPSNPAQKLIRDGNIYILTGDKTYTVTGQEVRL